MIVDVFIPVLLIVAIVTLFVRNEKTLRFREQILIFEPDRMKELPSHETMIFCFWKPLRRKFWLTPLNDERYKTIKALEKQIKEKEELPCTIIPVKIKKIG